MVEELRAENTSMRDSIDKNLSVIKVKQDSDELSIKEYKEEIMRKDTEIKELKK